MAVEAKHQEVMHAAWVGSTWVITIFMEFDLGGDTALDWVMVLIKATSLGRLSYVKALLVNRADVNKKCKGGSAEDSALLAAIGSICVKYKLKMVKLILSYGADAHGHDGSVTPLGLAQASFQNDVVKILKRPVQSIDTILWFPTCI